MATYEIEIKTSLQNLDVGPPGTTIMANLEVYNGTIPGPTIPNDFPSIPGNLNIGDTLIVRLINDLPHATGIHWHGIELQNNADGTPVTQDGIPGGDLQVLGGIGGAPVGGTYLYKFKVTRPGIFWYHPHHFHSTNRVFRGLYGMIIVTDPDESTLIGNTLPDLAETHQFVLSDITVCKTVNDTATYPPAAFPGAEWLSGVTAQAGPTPQQLCEVPTALNEDGSAALSSFAAGDVPNVQRVAPIPPGTRTVEGQTVLTNGRNVGARQGTPLAPGAPVGTLDTIGVQSSRGVRLQIVNCAFVRYFRLRLTDNNNNMVNLIRVGGEGGLLDAARIEGGTLDTWNTNYDQGEILIPPASRVDVVAVIPNTELVGNILTLWTRDYQRTGPNNPGNWAQIPSVPVAHFEVTAAGASPYTIADGTPLRAKVGFPGPLVEPLSSTATNLLTPVGGFVSPKLGMSDKDIQLTAGGGIASINGFQGNFSGFTPYTSAPHLNSTRYAQVGDILELKVTNMTSANHPFHLHGFSFQPISMAPRAGAPMTVVGSFNWDYQEFVDNINIPSNYTLTFRVRIEDRMLADETTPGGAFGRWLFHCHIFFHAHTGMISELVITKSDGGEKPYVDVGGSWTYAPSGGTAVRSGTFSHHDGKVITLIASEGNLTYPPGASSGDWDWELMTDPGGTDDGIRYVYITAEDSDGFKDQTIFRLKVGAPDDGSDNGDPHMHTVDGKRYDFQAVGEFVLLRDRDDMEIQTRQTPVPTANPITDSYSGLKACVSLNTAVAARVGSHRIAYQPFGDQGELQFYVDGKSHKLNEDGLDLDGHYISGFDVNGQTALRVDYANQTVLTVTPLFWNSHSLWYMNIHVAHTQADEGIIGPIAKESWLPKLSSGAMLGPRPESLDDRYIDLYKTFADSWRVTDKSSLFVYEPGTSTVTFTDKDWPAQHPPCNLKPQFEIPGAPFPQGTDITNAEQICQFVTDGDLNKDCVFDVATIGDADFAQGYQITQELRLKGTAVQIIVDKNEIQTNESLKATANVSLIKSGRPTPEGSITFLVDGVATGSPIQLDSLGRASKTISNLAMGEHKIQASYNPAVEDDFLRSRSPYLQVFVTKNNLEGNSSRLKWYMLILLILIILILLIWMIT